MAEKPPEKKSTATTTETKPVEVKAAAAAEVPRISAAKQRELDSAIATITKAYGEGAIMRLGSQVSRPIEVIPTGALAIDLALGVGGVPRGRVIEIYGPESSGKTTLMLHLIANAQKAGGVAAFIDAEHALDPKKPSPSAKRWPVPEPSTSSWSIRWPLSCPKPNSRAKWAWPPWACRPAS